MKKNWVLLLFFLGAFPLLGFAEESVCVSCHFEEEDLRGVVLEWQKSVHHLSDVSCYNCHGGNPLDEELAMEPEEGFIGVPTADEIPSLCGSCHLKGVNLSFAQNQGGTNCVSCHSSHYTKRAGVFMTGSLGGGIFIVFIILSLFFFFFGIFSKISKYKKGRPADRTDALFKRLINAFLTVLGNLTIFKRDNYAGVAHFLILWGFILLFIGTVIVWIDKILLNFLAPSGIFLKGGGLSFFSYLTDIGGLILFVGLILFLIRRIIRPPRLRYPEVEDLPPSKLTSGDWFFLALVLLLGFGGIFLEGIRILSHSLSLKTHSFLGLATAWIFQGIGESGASSIYLYVWWVHAISALFFFAYIPYSKAIHIVFDYFTIAFKEDKSGKILPAPLEGESLGYTKWTDLTWKELLDLDACTRCGRCHEVCPAQNSGTLLSPRTFILTMREYVKSIYGDGLLKRGKAEEKMLAGEVVSSEVLWSCTTCLSCMEVCPIKVEHLPLIVALRRSLIEQGEVDARLQDALMSLMRRGNSLAQSERMRAKWTQELDFKIKDIRKEPAEYLWWVGDYASYDPVLMENTRKVARILNQTGVDFGILYDSERNSGNDVRRVGEEGLFEMLVEKNIQTLEKCEFKAIFTTDPHTYHTIKNEYPLYGGEYKVLHYTEILDRLVKDGKLNFKKKLSYKVTYHDPCYLGRYNRIFEEPRNVIRVLGLELVEMSRNRENGYCCGAGGGKIWMEEAKVEERPSEQRVKEAAQLGVEILIVTCPKDLSMFNDAIKTLGLESKLVVKDLIELVEEALL